MNRRSMCALLSVVVILALTVSPALAEQNGAIIASAVVVPAQIYRLGFLTSGIVREVNVHEGDSVQAGQTLAVLNAPDLEYDLVAAQEAFRSAESNAELQRHRRIREFRNGRKFWNVVAPEVREIADAQAASAQARLDVAQAVLAQCTLTAPADATVAAVDVLPGKYVDASQVILTLATLDALQLETTDLSERDIQNVKLGTPVSITVEALDRTLNGTVTGISPKAETVGGDTVFRVTIALNEQPNGLLWGMTAEVSIAQ